jgi:GST-like protein
MMIDLYYWPTPNGWKVTIMLEECGLSYTIRPVNIGRGDQLSPSFLQLPNGRMPAIVDHEKPIGGGAPITIFESGAIIRNSGRKNRIASMKSADGFCGRQPIRDPIR